MKNFTNNKIANFWIRLLARLIDLFCLLIITTFLGLLFLQKNIIGDKTTWFFKSWWSFYVYALIVILMIFILFIALPIVWKGKTIGHFLTRTKIVSDSNLKIGILKREIIWSWSWIFCVILTMIFINHTLFDKFVFGQNDPDVTFSNWETLRISFVSSIVSIICFVQMLFAISIIIKNNKIAWHDTYSHTITVYINKFNQNKQIDDEINEILKPQKVPKIEINFIE